MTKDLKHLIYYRFNTGPVGKGPGEFVLAFLSLFCVLSFTILHLGVPSGPGAS